MTNEWLCFVSPPYSVPITILSSYKYLLDLELVGYDLILTAIAHLLSRLLNGYDW